MVDKLPLAPTKLNLFSQNTFDQLSACIYYPLTIYFQGQKRVGFPLPHRLCHFQCNVPQSRIWDLLAPAAGVIP